MTKRRPYKADNKKDVGIKEMTKRRRQKETTTRRWQKGDDKNETAQENGKNGYA